MFPSPFPSKKEFYTLSLQLPRPPLQRAYDGIHENDISNDIDYVEDNIIELYYKNKLYDINEQVNTILTPLIIENKYNRLEELLNNIINIYHTNKDKKKEYYSYILHIKNITIE